MADIDGMGSVVLAKLAFKYVDYELCESYTLQEHLQKYFDNGEIYNYDMIFVTDMWLEDPLLSRVASDSKLKGKFFVFDHHRSAIEGNFDRYSFTTIKIKDDYGRCCGTSLFFEYLVDNNYLSKSKGYYQFTENTRQYDTWEWKTRFDNEMPNELNLLFHFLGSEGYLSTMYTRLKDNKEDFDFTDIEKELINFRKIKIKSQMQFYADNIIYRDIQGLKAGLVYITNEFRNDFTQYLRDNNYPIDFVMLISLDIGGISYRNIKSDINVRLIAEKFGGKGHDYAAGSPITKEMQNKIIDLIINDADK